MSAERWRRVPNFPRYEVSDLGRVRSYHRHIAGRFLAGSTDAEGYTNLQLREGSRRHNTAIHRIVALAFIGPRPEGMQVRHLDGDPSNNTLTNLTYGTASENAYDRTRHGTSYWVRRTRCPQGHPYDVENTRHYRGRRYCRTCVSAASAASKARARQSRAEAVA